MSEYSEVLVSVVIPCYNHEAYLEETISSVMNSTFTSFEIIIIDDGSTDESLAKAEMIASQNLNIKVFTQKNSGPSAARNSGIRKAKGKYIFPLDADDLISSKYMEDAVCVLENNPQVKVVYAEAEMFGAVNEKWNLEPFSLHALALDNMIYVSAFYRKSDWERVGGYTEDPVVCREDWEFWIKLLKSGGKVVKLPFVGFYYRILPNSRRNSLTEKKKKKEIAYLNKNHSDFFYEQLKGPLRINRSQSKLCKAFRKAFCWGKKELPKK